LQSKSHETQTSSVDENSPPKITLVSCKKIESSEANSEESEVTDNSIKSQTSFILNSIKRNSNLNFDPKSPKNKSVLYESESDIKTKSSIITSSSNEMQTPASVRIEFESENINKINISSFNDYFETFKTNTKHHSTNLAGKFENQQKSLFSPTEKSIDKRNVNKICKESMKIAVYSKNYR